MTMPTPSADDIAMRERARAAGRAMAATADAAPSAAQQQAEVIAQAVDADTALLTTGRPSYVDATTGAVMTLDGDATDMNDAHLRLDGTLELNPAAFRIGPGAFEPGTARPVHDTPRSDGKGGRTPEMGLEATGTRMLAFACGARLFGVWWRSEPHERLLADGGARVSWREQGDGMNDQTMFAVFPSEELADKFADALLARNTLPTFGVSVTTQESEAARAPTTADMAELRSALGRIGEAAEQTGELLTRQLLKDQRREASARKVANVALVLLLVGVLATLALPGSPWPVVGVVALCVLNVWNNARCRRAASAALWTLPAILGGLLLGGGL